jgi:hypothetical protein
MVTFDCTQNQIHVGDVVKIEQGNFKVHHINIT